ncbi:fibronectin type III domain-containing protein, partial [Aequorivita capsosiphonis]|uniref:fibronectin type III domain-containing protein n=1 Tax=Aequorivita capsosiphonis TaxID=487317 RepID=UPI000557BFD9
MPFTDSGNTSTYGNDYSSSDMAPLAPNAVTNGSSANYLGGDDVVYSYTAAADGFINVNASGVGSWVGMYVFTGCSPFELTVGSHTSSISGARSIPGLPVTQGETYFIVISTWPTPDSTDYTLDIQAMESCEGTPEAGTAAIDPNTGPSGTTAQVTVDGYTEDAGITQRWEAKDENGDWVDAELGDGDALTLIFSGEQGDIIELRYAVTCSTSGETAYSNVISFTIDNVNCVPQYTSTTDYLSAINSDGAVSDISYSASSQPTGGYEDATTMVLEAYAGQSLDINTTYVGGNNTVNIWIDWDGSGIFEESEKTGPIHGGANQVLEITIPQDADNGEYIMRVRGIYDFYGDKDPEPCSTESYGSAVDFTVSVVDSPTCPAPTGLSVDNITENSADFSWTTSSGQSDVYLVESSEPAPDENSTPTDTGVTSPITLDNLTANTAYDAYVRSDCGAEGVSDWAGPETFTTLVTSPDNDDCSGAIALVCGQSISGNTLGATASGLSATCGNYTSSSALDLFYSFEADGESSYTVSLDQASGGSSFDGILFLYSGTCDDLTEIECSDSGNPESVELEAPAAGTYYVRIFKYSGTGEFVIDLECIAPVSCPVPTDLSVDNITETSADFNWTTTANQSDIYLVEAGDPAPDENSTPTDSGVTSPTSLDNLMANTAYDAYVRSDCGADGVSDWAGPVSFTTLATPLDNDDCSGAIALSCGDSVDGTTVGATESDLGNPSCATGTPADVFYTLDVIAGTEYTVTVQGADYDAVLAIYSGECDNLVEIDCADNGFSAGVEETITYTPDTDGTLVIRTYDWSSSQGSFTITVSCEAGSECETPTATTIDNITENSADITWTPADAADDQWDISITTIGQSPEDGMMDQVFVDASYTATGLDAATDYFVYVRTVCEPGFTSEWFGGTPFTTEEGEPDPCQDPYNEDAATSDVYISNIEIVGIGIDIGNPDYDFTYTSNDMSPNGYQVVTNPTVTVYPGLVGAYTVSSGPTGNSNQYYYSVWLDFNQDGCFDADEQI